MLTTDENRKRKMNGTI